MRPLTEPLGEKSGLAQIDDEAAFMPRPGGDEFPHRFLDQLGADIDGGEKNVPVTVSDRLKKRAFLLPRARAEPDDRNLFSGEPFPHLAKSLAIKAREFGIGMDGRMAQENLAPQRGLVWRRVEQRGIEPVIAQGLDDALPAGIAAGRGMQIVGEEKRVDA